MPLTSGSRVGSYEVIAILGAGGMGEVYRARDPRLGRDVALKVLPDAFAADVERLARFQREAQLLASLSHQNIGAIHGLEETPSTGSGQATVRALVLELIEGDTLADRIARGPVPVDEALPIARQIADALEAAHERGIVHRDLKPSNIKVTPEGAVKVLDFGLAKLAGPSDSGPLQPDLTASPTMVSPNMTSVGIILGTAAYMAPEQAKGKPADKRSDIWAFGCILFEMLAGRRAFEGDDVSEMLAAVIKGEPNWSVLPASTPSATRRLLRRCLERDPRRRLHDIADARLELDEQESPSAAPAPASRSRYRLAVFLALVLLGSAITGAIVWALKPVPSPPLRKLEISADLTAGVPPDDQGFEPAVRLSPDGSRAAYMARGHLWVRDLDQVAPRDLGQLPEGSETLAWSRDGTFIGFASGDKKYRKISIAGGPPVVVCDLPATGRITGSAWPTDETIVLAAWRDSLYKVSARGGTPEVWLKVDAGKEIDFHNPEPLPDGRVMFRTHTRGTGADEVSLLEMFDGTTRSVLLHENGIGGVAYAPPGYLLFVRQSGGGSLWAAPFDSTRLDMSKAFTVDGRGRSVTAGRDGTLLIGSPGVSTATRQLVRVDRAGRLIEELVPAGPDVSRPHFSPDGRKLAYHTHAGGNPDVWILDLPRKVATRLTFEAGEDMNPSWFPSGERIVYTRHGEEVEGTEIAQMAADGSGTPQGLIKGFVGIISPDGKYIVSLVDDRGFYRLRYAERRSDGTVAPPQRLLRSDPEPSQVIGMSLSADGRLLAYAERGAAGDGGVFITRFPSGEGRWQIADAALRAQSNLPGAPIAWSRSSNELFFLGAGKDQATFQLMSVPVSLDSTVTLGPAVSLFPIDAASIAAGLDVAPDGKSFVIGRDVSASSGDPALRTKFTLVENWFSEFARSAR